MSVWRHSVIANTKKFNFIRVPKSTLNMKVNVQELAWIERLTFRLEESDALASCKFGRTKYSRHQKIRNNSSLTVMILNSYVPSHE